MRVLDLGAAPGGWSQILAEKVESREGAESVFALDILEMNPLRGVKFVQGDLFSEKTPDKVMQALDYEKVDLVVSDAAPEFVGDRTRDHMQAIDMNKAVIEICEHALKPGGSLLMKIFVGIGEKLVYDDLKMYFKDTKRIKPQASRA